MLELNVGDRFIATDRLGRNSTWKLIKKAMEAGRQVGQVKFLWAKANLFINEIKGGLVLKNSSNIRKDEHMNVVVVLERLFVLGLINEYEYSKALTIANRISS